MSTQSNTPETDAANEAAWFKAGDYGLCGVIERITDFARTLERQRDAAVAEARELREDKARLDFLEGLQFAHIRKNHPSDGLTWLDDGQIHRQPTLRAAIDQARKPLSPENQQSENT